MADTGRKKAATAKKAAPSRTAVKKATPSSRANARQDARGVRMESAQKDGLAEIPRILEEMSTSLVAQAEKSRTDLRDAVVVDNAKLRRFNKLLVAMLAVVLLFTGLGQYRSIFQTGPLLQRVKGAVVGIQTNQTGIDSLVSFVNDIKAQECDPKTAPDHKCPPSPTEQLVGQLEALLCSSSDPVRVGACRDLHISPVVPGAGG